MKPFNNNRLFFYLIPLAGIFFILFHWYFDVVKADNLLFKIHPVVPISFFETHYLYVFTHLFAFIPVFCLSFDNKVAYYKHWRFVFPAIFIVAVPFWIWDIAKTVAGVWGFNPDYYTRLLINLPIEEWLFFITFPWASVFIYLCLNVYFPLNISTNQTRIFNEKKNLLAFFISDTEKLFTVLLICFFFVISLIYWGHLYTVTTFSATGFVLLWQFLYGNKRVRINFYRMFPIATIPFILINSVFTGAFTRAPIVVYNPEEYIGIRFFTIPLDDFAYNFLLTFSVIVIYDWFLESAI